MSKYHVTWHFVENRPPLKMLLPADSIEAARRRAESPNEQRSIFRRAGLARRTRSAHEYLDTFPTVKSIDVRKSRY